MISPKWIAFDVYATLMDREAGASNAFREILRRAGAEHLDASRVFNAWHYAVIRRYRSRFIPWKEAGREVMPELFRRFHIRNGDPQDIEILYNSFSRWKPYPDVVPMLSRLKSRFRLGAVTNMDTDLFLNTNIGVKFDGWVTSEEAGAAKPDPKIFQYSLDKFAVAPDELLWVGTTPWADVQGARLAGLPVVVWINRSRGKSCGNTRLKPWEPVPDYEFKDLYGLLDLLEQK